MIKSKQKTLKDKTTLENSVYDLKPMQALKGFDFVESDGFVCDMDTGTCGPINQEKETK